MNEHEQNHHDIDESLSMLSALIDAEFTKSEAQSLKDLVVWWGRLRGAVALGGALGSIAKWTLMMAAFFVALRAGIVDWLLQGMNK